MNKQDNNMVQISRDKLLSLMNKLGVSDIDIDEEISENKKDTLEPLLLEDFEISDEITIDDIDLDTKNMVDDDLVMSSDEDMSPINSLSYQNKQIDIPYQSKPDNVTEEQQYCDDEHVLDPPKKSNKITLNVGGKKFNLERDIIDTMGIDYPHLYQIMEDDRTIYFLDRDSYYFSKIINLIKMFGFDQEKILEHIDDYSDQFVNELCHYQLLDRKYNATPKIKLKKIVTFPSDSKDIIKIKASDQIFETSSHVLSKSQYFNQKLAINQSKIFYLNNTDPKLFRYVLNLLRSNVLYVNNADILQLLDNYGIEYLILENKVTNENIITHITSHDMNSVQHQVTSSIGFFDPRNNLIKSSNQMLQFIDGHYYHPENILSSSNVENINVINASSKIDFDTEIIFDLTGANSNQMGECIEDLILSIDIPALNPIESYEYINMIEYLITEHIRLEIKENNRTKIITQTNTDLLYLHPMIYHSNSNQYHQMTQTGNQRMKLLYNNQLIDVHRITIPLFLLKDRRNHLPIQKMINKQIKCQLVVKTAPITRLFKDKVKNISLLNIYLSANYINLASMAYVLEHPKENNKKNNTVVNKPKLIEIPINMELKSEPLLYLYDRTHIKLFDIVAGSNAYYNEVHIPLSDFGFIKDFFLIIVEKDSFKNNRIDHFSDALIELEIIRLKNVSNSKKTSLVPELHSKLDSTMMNQYLPLKKLGHSLPNGIYYHSFSADPKCQLMMGGLYGAGYLLSIKVKKMNGMIKFFANEYHREIF